MVVVWCKEEEIAVQQFSNSRLVRNRPDGGLSGLICSVWRSIQDMHEKDEGKSDQKGSFAPEPPGSVHCGWSLAVIHLTECCF